MKSFFKLPVLLMMSAFFISCDMTSSQKTSEEKNNNVNCEAENILSARSYRLTGKDLYLNSRFVRSLIPTSRFPTITRGQDLSDDSLFYNDDLIDSSLQEIYEKLTDEEKLYYEENAENILIDLDISLEATDVTNDFVKEQIKTSREINKTIDEICNSFGVNEVAVELEVASSGRNETPSDKIIIKQFKKANRTSRYKVPGECIIKASTLATYFYMNGEQENYDELCELFPVSQSIKEIKLLNGQNIRSGTKASAYSSELPGAYDFINEKCIDGDIISRCLTNSCIYGAYDHSGMFNKSKFNGSKWDKCILASYPTASIPVEERRKPTRAEYGAYEPLANFIDSKKIVINRVNLTNGKKALNKAIEHFYGNDGTKKDYDKWCTGFFVSNVASLGYHGLLALGLPTLLYTCVSETLGLTNASDCIPHRVNYCSYIPWYGYKYGCEIDLDSDVNKTRCYYMKVPEDIVNSATNVVKKVEVKVSAKGCGLFFGGGTAKYEYKTIYKKQSNIIFSKVAKDD